MGIGGNINRLYSKGRSIKVGVIAGNVFINMARGLVCMRDKDKGGARKAEFVR